jgi:hypothetical protein
MWIIVVTALAANAEMGISGGDDGYPSADQVGRPITPRKCE